MEFIGFWEEMITRLQTKELEEVISILRRIWFRLNKFVFEQIFINPRRVIMEALQEMTEFQQAQLKTNFSNQVAGNVIEMHL